MQAALILERRKCLWPCRPIGIPNRCGRFRRLRKICTSWRIGFSVAVWTRWRWSRRACIGYRCFKSWKDVELRSTWSMLNIVHHVPGRKSDVLDCQWLQYLHSVGLLRASFRPEQAVCEIRSLMRHRENLVQMACVHVQHMHKSLDQMNLQIHHVISDITGVTGLAIVDAIVAGETDPDTLAKLRDHRIKASMETVRKSLVGDYAPSTSSR